MNEHTQIPPGSAPDALERELSELTMWRGERT